MSATQAAIKLRTPSRAPRAEEPTRARILAVAAEWFADHGYAATSMRDIAGAVGLTPGALYVHFASKGQLLLAVYAEGVTRIGAAVAGVLEHPARSPWGRLEAASEAHLRVLLGRAGVSRVIVRGPPSDGPEVAGGLGQWRDFYEQRFVDLFAALDLRPGTDRRLMRLMLLGALNATQTWAKSGTGRAGPGAIARHTVAALRLGIAAEPRRTGAAP